MINCSHWCFKWSKKLHRRTGLFLSLFLLWMGISGILLNHPGLVKRISLPMAVMPEKYQFKNWNRMAFRDSLVSEALPGVILIAGKQGVWMSRDRGKIFIPLNNGFPASAWEKDTFCMVITKKKRSHRLYAGTRSGLYSCDIAAPVWEKIPGLDGQEVVSLIQDPDQDRIFAFTRSGGYIWNSREARLETLVFPPSPSSTRTMAGFLLDFHDGSILGLPGRLIMDTAAGTLSFLALSGVMLWTVGRFRRRLKGKKRIFRLYRICRAWHLRLGIWLALFLVLTTATGMAVRPPFLKWIYQNFGKAVNLKKIPGGGNSWEDQIFKAALVPDPHAPPRKQFLFSTRTGFYTSPVSMDRGFERLEIPVRVSGMGTNVLELLSGNRLLIGSFAGLYTADLGTGKICSIGSKRPGRGSSCTGVLVTNGQVKGWADYRKGFIFSDPLAGRPESRSHFAMPPDLNRHAGISLWHALFELHNSRVFDFLLDASTWLIIPAGGGLTLVLLFTGILDWAFIRIRSTRAKKRNSQK